MKNNPDHTEVTLMLLNIQNNLIYVDTELNNLGITEEEKMLIRSITDPYIVALYDAQSEWAKIGESSGIITIDPILEERTDTLSESERIDVIKGILNTHNQALITYTDALITRRDTIASDTEMTGLMVLVTESAGNILRLTKQVMESITN